MAFGFRCVVDFPCIRLVCVVSCFCFVQVYHDCWNGQFLIWCHGVRFGGDAFHCAGGKEEFPCVADVVAVGCHQWGFSFGCGVDQGACATGPAYVRHHSA
jgi:hypothetical protein